MNLPFNKLTVTMLLLSLPLTGFCILPLDGVAANGVVVPWEGGLVFRFRPDGRNIFALDDPQGLLGEFGRRVRIEGALTPNLFNGLPLVYLERRSSNFGELYRSGPFMQPAGVRTSETFFKEELDYAARLRVGFETADADQDGITDAFDPDDDNDGMPDTYELQEGLNSKLDDGDLDKDGDGMTNDAEFRAGTLAGDSTSFLGILAVSLLPPNVCINWSSVSGKVYRVMAAAAPGQTPAVYLSGVSANTNQPTTEACVPDNGTFYYIQLEEP